MEVSSIPSREPCSNPLLPCRNLGIYSPIKNVTQPYKWVPGNW